MRLAMPVAADEDDQTAWLTTFADIVLQLFAFILLATALTKARPAPAPAVVEKPVARVAALEPSAPSHARPVEAPDVVLADPLEAEPAVAEEPAVVPEPTPVAAAPAPVVEAPAPDPTVLMAAQLRATLADRRDVAVTAQGGGVVVSIGEAIGFPSASADLLPTASPVLDAVRDLARSLPDLQIQVSGHTDDRPIRSARYPSNLELSLARAARVARAIAGDDPSLVRRTSAVGYGAERPLAPNADASGRAMNRRVEVRLTPAG